MQTNDKYNSATAANWVPNNPLILKAPNTFNKLEERVQNIENEKNGISWYLSFQTPKEYIDSNINENTTNSIDNINSMDRNSNKYDKNKFANNYYIKNQKDNKYLEERENIKEKEKVQEKNKNQYENKRIDNNKKLENEELNNNKNSNKNNNMKKISIT